MSTQSHTGARDGGPSARAARGLAESRRRLAGVLGEIAALAGERSLKRCPYRAAGDVCTYRGSCGNRYASAGHKPVCTGGPLDARGPSPEELAAALSGEGAGAAGTAWSESEAAMAPREEVRRA